MKATIATLALVLASSLAMAQGAGGAGAGAPPAAEPPAKKMSAKDAKKACKAEGKKGADMKACVKEKMSM